MERLSDLQRAIAARLAGVESPSAGPRVDGLERARRALETKRRRAAVHLLPQLRLVLGPEWAERFRRHAERYRPSGLVFHVDDGWEFAVSLSASRDPAIRGAAHDDLLRLRLRYVRSRRSGTFRIRQRRSPLVAVTQGQPRMLVLRFPGAAGRVCRIPFSGR